MKKRALVFCALVAIVIGLLFLSKDWIGSGRFKSSEHGGATETSSAAIPSGTKSSERDHSVQTVHGDPSYKLRRSDGKLNEEILTLGGIPSERSSEFEALLDEYWSEMAKHVEEEAQLLSSESGNPDPETTGVKNLREYSIKSAPNFATDIKERLTSDMTSKFGRGAATILVPYLTRPERVGGFGEYDIHLKIYDFTNAETSTTKPIAEMEVSDPKSGKVVSKMRNSTPSAFYDSLGNAFGRGEK